jgi:DNA-binding IclR family transcriptional regulator
MNERNDHVIGRVIAILEDVVARGDTGARLLDIASSTGISRPTVHRILNELKRYDYISQLTNKRYVAGSKLFTLSYASQSTLPSVAALTQVCQELADRLGDTVYIGKHYFDAVLYVTRAFGFFPVRAITVEPGAILPLATSYSGVAFLSLYPAEKREQLIAQLAEINHSKWGEKGVDEQIANVRKGLQQMEELGYLYGADYVIPGLSGATMLIPSDSGAPSLSISVSAINNRLPPERKEEVIAILRSAVEQIKELISS